METATLSVKIIIKFKDNFLINENAQKAFGLQINKKHYDYSKDFLSIQKKVGTSDFKYNDNFLKAFFNNFNEKGYTTQYLFEKHPLDIFCVLTKDITNKKVSKLPNFYNFFEINLTPSEFKDFEDMNLFIFNQLYLLYPTKKLNCFTDTNTPLEYIYVRGIPATTSDGSVTLDTLSEMEMPIPNSPLSSTNKPVTLFDLEYSWNINSPYLVNNLQSPFFPNNYDTFGGAFFNEKAQHGTKTLSVLKSKTNDGFIEGLLTDNITMKLSSVFNTTSPTNTTTQEENALLACLYNYPNQSSIVPTRAGSVILIELYTPPFPLEIQPAIFHLIELATLKGLIVIEAAGNNGKNFDKTSSIDPIPFRNIISRQKYAFLWQKYNETVTEYVDKFGSYPLTILSTTSIISNFKQNDSGAIIVGAYNKSRLGIQLDSFSNFDTLPNQKVKIFAFGGNIQLNRTDSFNDTSAAAAIIAAFVVAIQSHSSTTLNNEEILSILLKNSMIQSFIKDSFTFNGHIPQWASIRNTF